MAPLYTKRSYRANPLLQNLLLQAGWRGVELTFLHVARESQPELGAKRPTTEIMGLVTRAHWWIKRASSKEAPFVCTQE